MAQTPHRIEIDYDPDPDFSWIADCYREAEAWCRDPDEHVQLEAVAYDIDGNVLDSLGNIDFFKHYDDWGTGTFYRIEQIPEGYLRDIARDMNLPE